ncbi:hypothetical protein GCM10022224_041800 [Nonomuraea antimicrobica]|uniref:Uncharacterized protein n=1 Tax=Nonomuraea antimicrobica TaxID=561173 RepID=A0ABP7C174_9ACTN
MTVIAPPTLAEPPDEPNELAHVRTCFAIGPIGDSFAAPGSRKRKTYEEALEIFEHVILAACGRFGIKPVRADDLPGSGEITDQICRHIREADIVIADLGGGNPNVMYELGLRHATGKPTIQLGDHKRLPFDISNVRTIKFARTKGGLIEARKALEDALEAGMRDGFDLLTPARIIRSPVDGSASVYPVHMEEDQETPGLLEDLALIETEMVQMTDDLEEIGACIKAIGALTEAAAPDFKRAASRSARVDVRMALMAKYVLAVSGPADDLEASATRFAERMQATDGGVRGILRFFATTPREHRRDDNSEFLHSLIELAKLSSEGMKPLDEFGTTVDWASGFSRQLRKPLMKISGAVGKVTFAASRINEWAEAARALL